MIQMLRNSIAALKDHPLALALVLINLLYIAAGAVVLREIGQAAERRDALLTQIAARCLP